MPDMMKTFFEMLLDWPIGTIISILTIVCVIMVALIVIYLLYTAIDRICGSHHEGSGVVVSKTFTPSYTTTTLVYNAVTKMSTPIVIYHPDVWSIEVEVQQENGNRDSVLVSQELYKAVQKGARILIGYTKGGLCRDNIYITDVELAK